MDTEEQAKESDTPLREVWQPQEHELVWLHVARRDGKVSTFRVRVLKVNTDDEPAVEVEVSLNLNWLAHSPTRPKYRTLRH